MLIVLLVLILFAIIMPNLVRILIGIVMMIIGLAGLMALVQIADRHFDKPAQTTWEQVSPTPWQPVLPYRRSQP